MEMLPEIILRHAGSFPEGSVLSPKEFLRLGSGRLWFRSFSQLIRTCSATETRCRHPVASEQIDASGSPATT
jgi:hypothetical protein